MDDEPAAAAADDDEEDEAEESTTTEPTLSRPPTKQKKSDKLYARREALLASPSRSFPSSSLSLPLFCPLTLPSLLAEITAGSNPYSKSHVRRQKRAERPTENLITGLEDVRAALVGEGQLGEGEGEREGEKEQAGSKEATENIGEKGKGKEKLTSRKRARVL